MVSTCLLLLRLQCVTGAAQVYSIAFVIWPDPKLPWSEQLQQQANTFMEAYRAAGGM